MGQIEKLIDRFRHLPTDLTYDDLTKLLNHFNYEESNAGKTSGSRVRFIRKSDNAVIMLHKPHPDKIMKLYQVRQVYEYLLERGDICE